MILTDVLTATDMNPTYYKFIPIFIRTWKKIFPSINIHIILIATEIIDELKPYSQYITLFPPIEGMKTAFIAQNIRLLYPSLIDASGGILITDMDMVPMGKKYYIDQIKNIDNSKFVCYRPLRCVGKNEMVMCYNIAHRNIWKEIFKINTPDDIINTLNSIYKNNYYSGLHGGPGWCLDQLFLYAITQEWNKKTNSLIILNNDIHVIRNNNIPENMFVRLWKYYDDHIIKFFLKQDNIVDFHMPRPYNDYKRSIDKIINLL